MKFIVGKKENMTQIFDDRGVVHGGTVIVVPPVTVTQVKDGAKDGYRSLQVGFGEKDIKKMSKPLRGHLKNLSGLSHLKEFRMAEVAGFSLGDKRDVSQFASGDIVRVSAISKGKGFQGVVKRHGFKGGPRSHGQKHSEREPGSIGGAGRQGGRVAKGKRMAGRMGGDRVTVRNLAVLAVDAGENRIIISGAVPGRRGTIVEIRG